MKFSIYLLLIIFAMGFISCEDVQMNNVALQAKIDNATYTSLDARASKNPDGSFLIQGTTERESLTLRISDASPTTYYLGEGSSNYAVFEDRNGNFFTTDPDGTGQITITEWNQAERTLTGTFKFMAVLAGQDTIYADKGFIFEVPYSGEDILDPTNAGTFTANVDGNPFLPSVLVASETTNNIIITAASANNTITLGFPISVEPGNFSLPYAGFIANYKEGSQTKDAAGGNIAIAEHDVGGKKLKGTFSFFTDVNEITQGTFEVVYH